MSAAATAAMNEREIAFDMTGLLSRTTRPLCCMLLLICCALAPSGAEAACRAGAPLLEHVNSSDAVAVIRRTDRVERLSGGVTRVYFSFVDMLKPPLSRVFDRSIPQLLYLEESDPLFVRGPHEYLAFLRYTGPNSWSAGRCGFLPINRAKEVLDACTAIADLFSDRPYDRERLCLLRYPPSAELRLVQEEILAAVRQSGSTAGAATSSIDFRFNPAQSYQRIVFELNARERRKFFAPQTVKQSFPIVGYVKTSDVKSPEELERLLRKGRRFKFTGEWQQGSFIVNALE